MSINKEMKLSSLGGIKSMKWNRLLLTSILTILLLFLGACSNANEKEEATNEETTTEETAEQAAETEKKPGGDLILATTTSTQDSGLLDELIPIFEEQTNVNVKTIAVGTGQALEMGTKGEADALLVHSPKAEEEIVESGDPAGVKGLPVTEAFKKILSENAVFVSRGDDSGTHKKEVGIWETLELTPTDNPNYASAGQGMGATLKIGNEKNGYLLTDRATWLSQKDSLEFLDIVVEGDKELLNIYHVMQVNSEKHDKVNAEAGEAFVDFMVNEETLKVIEKFGVEEYGEPLFSPDTEE